MARVPNWGPSAGQPVPDEQWGAYMQANPPPANASFSAGPAAQPQGSTGATLGAPMQLSGDQLDYLLYNRPAEQGLQGTGWDGFFADMAAGRGGHVNMPQFQTGNSDQDRLQQQQVIQDLQRQAAGDPNSLAQQQLSQGYGAAQAQQSSLGSTMRGQSAGAAMRGVQAGQQGIQRGYAGDQQMLQQQEQQAAQAMLAQLLAQQHGQDVNQATGMANTTLQGNSLQDAMRQFYVGGNIKQALGNYQYGNEFNLAKLGMDLDSKDIRDEQNRKIAGAGATAAATISNAFTGSGKKTGSGFRQIDGTDSIVPEGDK